MDDRKGVRSSGIRSSGIRSSGVTVGPRGDEGKGAIMYQEISIYNN